MFKKYYIKTLDVDHINYIHAAVLDVSKGQKGLCPGKLVESIVKRIDESLYYQGILSLFDIAAIVVLAITQGRVFKYGNEGTALIALCDFLCINGYGLVASEKEAAKTVVEVEKKQINFKDLAAWIKVNTLFSQNSGV